MKFEDISIYHYIKDYLEELDLVSFKKGQYITRASQGLEEIFFILEGNVAVEYLTRNGKSFLVDELCENEFVGNMSYLYNQNLFCDSIATSDVSLLKIKKNTLKQLQQDKEFLNFFFYKTSKRIYCIYKKLMMKDLFQFDELLAFHILKNAEDDRFKFKSMYSLCQTLAISRKNLYNTINRFTEQNYLRKDKNELVILNRDYLDELSTNVREFNETQDSDFVYDWR